MLFSTFAFLLVLVLVTGGKKAARSSLTHKEMNRMVRNNPSTTPPPPAVMQRSNPLKSYPPLPKTHLSWPIPDPYGLEPNYADGVWEDYVRITGSFPVMLVDLNWYTMLV
jgi:hypothetical protein